MIKLVQLKFGASSDTSPLEFTPGPMTVFVGANNSGKSLILREIESFVDPQSSSIQHIVAHVELTALSVEEVHELLSDSNNKRIVGNILEEQLVMITVGNMFDVNRGAYQIYYRDLCSGFVDGSYNGPYLQHFATKLTLRLDGQTRLTLTNAQPSSDLQQKPQNHLTALFKDQQAREALRKVIVDAFPGRYFVIDPTGMRMLRIRICRRPRNNDIDEEQFLGTRSQEFHAQATLIEELSDGVKAFTGLTAAVFSANLKTILIDEPEAFLHPPLARKLGKVLAQTAAQRGGNVFASTHSSDFLMGCVQSGRPVNVVRLTYQDGTPSARLLPSDELKRLMRDPLLRSTGVLNALFHEGTIVCEADVDRAFYEEINQRLSTIEQGASDALFTNAQNKQTIRRIIAPLRKMGVPAAAVVDLDILEDRNLTALLRAAFVPDHLIDAWGLLRKRVLDEFVSQNVDLKTQGVQGLSKSVQEVADNLLASVAEYGVFIVPVGELEQWLAYLEMKAEKSRWLITIFERMGADPNDPNYVHPKEGDVWDFVRNIAAWIVNPNRKGMP